MLAAHPAGTFPEKLPAAELKALYRLLGSDAVTHASVLASHFAATQAYGLAAAAGPVLILHDTTVLDYSGLHAVEGLGPIGDGRGRGYYCHNSLAVSAGTRAVLGLVAQTVAPAAGRSSRGETRTQSRDQDRPGELTLGQTRSPRFRRSAPSQSQIDALPTAGRTSWNSWTPWTVAGRGYVVRSLPQPPGENGGESEVGTLHAAARTRPSRGTRSVSLPATAERPARVATLSVSWTRVALLPPRQPCGHTRGVPLDVDVVRVWEPTPPDGGDAVEWLLLTNRPVESLDDAIARIDWYATRWVIEVDQPQCPSRRRLYQLAA